MLENFSKDKKISKLISSVNAQDNGLVIGEKALCDEYIAIYENPKNELEIFKMNIWYEEGKHLELRLIDTNAFKYDSYSVNRLTHIAGIIYQTPELNAYDNSIKYYKDEEDNVILYMKLGKRKKA